MKLLKAITVSAAVMAAACTTTEYEHLRPSAEEVAAYEAWKSKQPKTKFQPGTDMMGIVPSAVTFNEAPAAAPASAPQPVIITGPNSGTTVATQVGATTIVSQFGGYRPPIYTPPAPIYTGSRTPLVYTMPIQQP